MIKNPVKKRYDYIDFLKGAGIFLVVWGHTMFPRSIYIYSFHMPLFFFLSGYLYKAKPLKEFIVNKINSLYIPYFLFTLLSWLFYYFRHTLHGTPNFINGHLPKLASVLTGDANNGGNNPIWFLTCILVISIIFAIVDSFIKKPVRVGTVIFGLSLIGYKLSVWDFDLPFKIDVACTGIVFYYLGYLVKQGNWLSLVDKLKPFILLAGLLFGEVLHIVTAYWNVRVAAISWVNMAGNVLGNYFLFHTSACLAIAVFIILGYKLKSMPMINFLGANSLVILALHKPLLRIFQDFCGEFRQVDSHLYGLIASIMVIIILIPVIKFCDRHLPRLVGKQVFFTNTTLAKSQQV